MILMVTVLVAMGEACHRRDCVLLCTVAGCSLITFCPSSIFSCVWNTEFLRDLEETEKQGTIIACTPQKRAALYSLQHASILLWPLEIRTSLQGRECVFVPLFTQLYSCSKEDKEHSKCPSVRGCCPAQRVMKHFNVEFSQVMLSRYHSNLRYLKRDPCALQCSKGTPLC